MLHTRDDYKTVNSPDQRHRVPWQAVGVSLCLILLQLQTEPWLYQRSLINLGDYWRVWTGNWVHTNTWHLTLNLAGFWLLFLLNPAAFYTRCLLPLIAYLGLGVGMGLWWFNPEVQWYVGFSGVLYGLYFQTGIQFLNQKDRLSAALILAGICGKTLWDWQHQGESISSALVQAPIIYAAHGYGMVSSLLWSMIQQGVQYAQKTA